MHASRRQSTWRPAPIRPRASNRSTHSTPSSTEWTASGRAGAFAPNVFVDISDELDRKLDAMRCYESELRPPPHPRSLRSLEQRAAYWGSVANMPAAEALALLRTRR